MIPRETKTEIDFTHTSPAACGGRGASKILTTPSLTSDSTRSTRRRQEPTARGTSMEKQWEWPGRKMPVCGVLETHEPRRRRRSARAAGAWPMPLFQRCIAGQRLLESARAAPGHAWPAGDEASSSRWFAHPEVGTHNSSRTIFRLRGASIPSRTLLGPTRTIVTVTFSPIRIRSPSFLDNTSIFSLLDSYALVHPSLLLQ